MVTAIVLLLIAIILLIFPKLIWRFGTSNMINDGSNGWEDIRSLQSMAKKHRLKIVRISGVIFLNAGIVILILL
ncbi:hypothetical protein PALU110988_14310 [Paenibacillus lupini]|nr:hypothetical protein [Paenibacillus lupini]